VSSVCARLRCKRETPSAVQCRQKVLLWSAVVPAASRSRDGWAQRLLLDGGGVASTKASARVADFARAHRTNRGAQGLGLSQQLAVWGGTRCWCGCGC